MTPEKKDWQASLKLAQKTLDGTDKEKYPKMYKIRKELVDTLQYNDNMRVRAEKAEKKAKETNPPKKEVEKETPTKPTEIETPTKDYSIDNIKDIRALQNVHDEDVDRVSKWAKDEGISISEALKNDDLKAIIDSRDEKRTTAAAANTGGSTRKNSKTTAKDITRQIDKGEMPDISDDDFTKLAEDSLKKQQE